MMANSQDVRVGVQLSSIHHVLIETKHSDQQLRNVGGANPTHNTSETIEEHEKTNIIYEDR